MKCCLSFDPVSLTTPSDAGRVQDPPSRYLQVLNALPTLGLVDAHTDSTQRAVKLLTRLAQSTPNGTMALRAVEYYASAELLVVTCATAEDATLLLLRLAQQSQVCSLAIPRF